MSIRKSARADVEGLIAELRAHPADGPRREGALARLAVIGPRAIVRLLAALRSAPRSEDQVALLEALERIPDARSIEAVLRVLEANAGAETAGTAVRRAAVRAGRPLLGLAPAGTRLLERLTLVALDAGEPLPVRRAAVDALSDLPARTVAPIRQRLREDPDPAVRALADAAPSAGAPDIDSAQVPDTPQAALDLVARMGADAPFPVLHALLAPLRAREAEGGRRRAEWTAVRGAVHLALARRDSRVGLYDLREAFETPALHPLPSDFMVALQLLGDGSCLEPLARAWMDAPPAATAAAGRGAWSSDVAETFRALLRKERPAARRGYLQRLERRWGRERVREMVGGTYTLNTPSRTAPAPSRRGRT